MDDLEIRQVPAVVDTIRRDTRQLGFTMASEPQTGSLLRTLAASKPSGRFLELGTGTGVGTAWLLAGMDERSRLDSVENDAKVLEVARRHLGHDPRVTFHLADGEAFLAQSAPLHFDFIYADTWPGKFTHVDLALSLLKVGGIYFIDDLTTAGVMAGGARTKGSGADHGAGNPTRICCHEVGLGVRAYDARTNECRLTRT